MTDELYWMSEKVKENSDDIKFLEKQSAKNEMRMTLLEGKVELLTTLVEKTFDVPSDMDREKRYDNNKILLTTIGTILIGLFGLIGAILSVDHYIINR